MSSSIDQENPSTNGDRTDATNNKSKNYYIRWTSSKVRSFLTYRGLNQHVRTCLKKTRDVVVTGSQSASSRTVIVLQSKTQSQQRQNAKEIVSEEYTKSDGENRTCVRFLKRFKMHMNVLSLGRKTYLSFQ